jgi:DNA repair exonuclease SbcCD nuclease subunit
MKNPSAILTSDWHLREDKPTCRTDDFWEVQWNKVDWIAELQHQYNCPVLHAGDLFHHWKPSPYLLSTAIEHLPNKFWTVYGQHDLPQHNMDLAYKCGIFVLYKAGKIRLLPGRHWNQSFEQMNRYESTSDFLFKRVEDIDINRNILVWHDFTYIGKEPFPGAKGKAHVKLEKYKQFDLIVTGDNHQSFTLRGTTGNLLVNPGNITRQSAAQIDFRPKVYLWFAETNTVEAIEIPAPYDVITREHIEVKQEHDKRMEAYISKMDTNWELTTNFDDNLERFFQTNRVRRQVKDIIYKCKEQ